MVGLPPVVSTSSRTWRVTEASGHSQNFTMKWNRPFSKGRTNYDDTHTILPFVLKRI